MIYKWFRFQWSWVTLNLDFKVAGLLLTPSTCCVCSLRAICSRWLSSCSILCISATYAVVAVTVCLPVTFVFCVEMSKHIRHSNFFPPSGTVDPPFVFFRTKRYGNIPRGTASIKGDVECRWVWKNRHVRPISRFIPEMIRESHNNYYETPIGTHMRSIQWCLSNDLEWPLTQISRSHHYLTLNISETVRDRDIHRVPKKEAVWCLIITLADVDWLLKFFHQVICEKILYTSQRFPPHLQ